MCVLLSGESFRGMFTSCMVKTHSGDGFGLWLLAAVLPLLDLSAKTSRRIAIGMIITAWTIVIASCFDPLFPSSRGLALTGDSSLTNDIAFLLFVIGIGIVVAIMCRVAYQCLFVRSKL